MDEITLEDSVSKTLEDSVSKTLEDSVSKTLEDAVSKTLEDAVSKTLEDAVSKTQEDAVSKTQEDAVSKTQEDAVSKTLEDAVSKTQEDTVSKTQEQEDAVSKTQEQEDAGSKTQEDVLIEEAVSKMLEIACIKMLEIAGSKFEDDSSLTMGRRFCQKVSIEPKTSVGAGITNMGMTCYMSAILQCLSHSHDFYNALQQSILMPTSKHEHGISEFCILQELYNHILDAFRPGPEPRIVTPHKLSGNLQLLSTNFKLWHQQDAHEYLLFLFEKLNDCDANLVEQIFVGFLLTRHKCMRCGDIEENSAIFNHFTLNIHTSKSLFESLRDEVCVHADIVCRQCTTCKGKEEWEKMTFVGKSPKVLVLHVNRFSWDCNGKKINRHVEFSPELVLPTSKDRYRLYALVVHVGSQLRTGHYVSFVRPYAQWYYMSDSLVEAVSEAYVMKQKAYLLFYLRE